MRSKFRICQSFRTCFWVAMILLLIVKSVSAQTVENNYGFDKRLLPFVTGSEILKQDDLFAMEVQFKPMRMLRVEVTDPKTGVKKVELVWYLVYKAINRDLGRRTDRKDIDPQNDKDSKPKPLFAPEFTLVTDDNGKQKVFPDLVIPEAQKIIALREARHSDGWKLKNSVQVVEEVPPVTLQSSKSEKNAVYGVAMWKNVDSTTDHFTVFMSGFSSSYQTMKGPDGETIVSRQTIQQDFWRPGDHLDEHEAEIRRIGDPKWIFRPDDVKAVKLVDTKKR